MKSKLLLLASIGTILFGFYHQRSPVAAIAAITVAPTAYAMGKLDQKKQQPDIEALKQRILDNARAIHNQDCDQRLAAQRSRIESKHNQALIEAVSAAKNEIKSLYSQQCRVLNAEIDKLKQQIETERQNHVAALARCEEIKSSGLNALATAHASEIETLNERLATLEALAKEYNARKLAIQRAEERITEYRATEKAVRLEIKHQAEQFRQASRTISTLQDELQSMRSAAIQQYNDGLKLGTEQGQQSALDACKTELERRALKIEQLENKIATLEIKLKGKADRDRFDASLPELSTIISKAHKPIAVEGSQGSGKALAIANAIAAYSNGLPAIVLVLDISEAEDPDSSWRRLGIPCTADPLVFADFLCAIAEALPTRPHRNNRSEYDRVPPIFAVVDEAMCAFDSLDEELIKERIKKPLRALESRGHKRKVFPIVATQDGQIQNLKAGNVALWNTGTLKNYYKILLNDGLRESVSSEELERDPDLAKFIDSFDGKFIAAIESVTGRGKRKQPIKHPSHHGLDLLDTVPNRGVERIEIAPMPDWLPTSCKQAYSEFLVVSDQGDPTGDLRTPSGDNSINVTTAKPLPSMDCDDFTEARSPAALAAKHGLSEDDVVALLDSYDEGLSMSKAVTAIATKSSRKNSKYQKARALYLSL